MVLMMLGSIFLAPLTIVVHQSVWHCYRICRDSNIESALSDLDYLQ